MLEASRHDRGRGSKLGRRRRKTAAGTWTYSVALDPTGPSLTLRCSEPATEDPSGLHRTFWLADGGNIVVSTTNEFSLLAKTADP